MKKLFYFIITFLLLTASCSKDNDIGDDSVFQGSNDNHLIAGKWVLSDLVVKELKIDNQDAAQLILEEYRKQIGEVLGFYDTGVYFSSGSFFEIPCRYKLKDNVLIFSSENIVKVTFEDNMFSYKSDYTSAFEWFVKEAPFMSKYKNTNVTKVVLEKVYRRVTNEDL